jgi:3-hydroxyisobutyrate dehydrogenase
MSKIGFIGVGNMGAPMVRNLIKAGHQVTAFDLSKELLDAIAQDGATIAASASDAATDVDVVITMLPAGAHVKDVYFSSVFENASKGTLMIDSSTIDVDTSREVHKGAAENDFLMIDAPVSGGVGGAAAGTLTFMVGGEDAAFAQAKPFLEIMGKTIVHCGGAGNGQAAKVCNNLMLGIQMSSVSEAFVLAEKLGLDAQKLFDVSSTATGQCWSLTSYCPVPGPVPVSPANKNYEPGFTAAFMLKDLNLAMAAAKSTGVNLQLGEKATELYQAYADAGGEQKDFSGIIHQVRKGGAT